MTAAVLDDAPAPMNVQRARTCSALGQVISALRADPPDQVCADHPAADEVRRLLAADGYEALSIRVSPAGVSVRVSGSRQAARVAALLLDSGCWRATMKRLRPPHPRSTLTVNGQYARPTHAAEPPR